MPRRGKRGYVPPERKPEVKHHLMKINAQVRGTGRCLYIIDANGNSCGNMVTNDCHVIPKNTVLAELKDSNGKVLELRWGVGKWQNLFLSSSEDSQIDTADLDALDPQSLGIGDACVRWFACKDESKGVDHDGEFGPIDVREPDFDNPAIRVLAMYRTLLYTLDWMKLGIRLSDQWKKQARGLSYRKAFVEWLKQQHTLNKGRDPIEQAASRLGKMWHEWKINRNVEDDAILWKSFNFYSNLNFAACGFYGPCVVNVVPVGEDRHKMTILYFSEDADSIREQEHCLNEVTTASNDGSGYGVEVLGELLTRGEGTVAVSPESYRGLPEGQKRTTDELVAGASRADMIETILGL